MDPVKYTKENDVSDPLKHLLSLDWESSTPKSKDFHTEDEQGGKSVKKVRFSDEIEEFLCDIDDSEINETNLSILEKNINIYTDHAYCVPSSEELLKTSNQNDVQSELNLKVEVDSSDNEADVLANNSATIIEPNNLTNENTLEEIEDFEIEKVMHACENENSSEILREDIPTVYNVSEIDINSLATQIGSMSIQLSQKNNLLENEVWEKVPSTSTSPEHHSESQEIFSGDDESNSVLQKNVQHLRKERNEHRIYQKSCNGKQSRKLNSALTKEANISNAFELKTTVYKAWYKVKNKEKLDNETISSRCGAKSCIETPLRKSKEHKSASKQAYTVWKKSKKIQLLQSKHKEQQKNEAFSHVSKETSKTEEEEIEMAFKSWKKRKDEILKNESVKEKRKEQQCIQMSSMTAIQKKKESEEAFFAWEAHKSHLMEIESKKKAWLLQKERAEYAKKRVRDKEALEMYYLWLETKNFTHEKNSTSSVQLKPPWIPPGKSSM